MTTTHSLGFPRIGPKRELKFGLEAYWQGTSSRDELVQLGQQLRARNWEAQRDLDLVPVGDFSFYDHVLDMSVTLGNLPARVAAFHGHPLDNVFRVARGRSASLSSDHAVCCGGVSAGEMTKWFDTNYHYIVPELTAETTFQLDPSRLLSEIDEARCAGSAPKPVLIGPLTYLWLGKTKDGSDKRALLPRLLRVYVQLLTLLGAQGVTWVQIDEPVLVTELDEGWRRAFETAYARLAETPVKLLLATYFGELHENRDLVARLPVAGIHVDAVNGRNDVEPLVAALPSDRVLSLGVVNGRNIWKTDLNAVLDWLEPVHRRLGDRLWLAPSCSLLHVPVDLENETRLDPEVKSWLAFAVQKLEEIRVLATALEQGRTAVRKPLDANRKAVEARRSSTRVHDPELDAKVATLDAAVEQSERRLGQRQSPYPERARKQAARLQLPNYPTTTIGSYPQTAEIRRARHRLKTGELDVQGYNEAMRQAIATCVHEQEALGLDVLVHGEPERNDMVEYFGEQLDGFAVSEYGWVQSYGSRCVKPPILFGVIRRPQPMTVEWAAYAQSLTRRPMKGMLTGPVTILNWSFVRDDQPRSTSCYQLALALREEVLELERAGVRVIQIDEAALREGLPLRRTEWARYLEWAVRAFRIAANGVRDETQIHTHMCYSEFNDILPAIADMDADVITIETARSDMELLDAFDAFNYPNEIGPGVYDIHSPNVPSQEHIVSLMRKAAQRVPPERLWVNPDCGLKTRQWAEVVPALRNMVAAAKTLRQTS